MSEEQSPEDESVETPSESAGDETPPQNPVNEHLKSRSTWMRLLFMLIMAFFYGLSRLVVTAVVIVQFLWVLFTGESNQKLLGFGQSLSTYTYQIVRYLTFNSEERPYPFDADWPADNVVD